MSRSKLFSGYLLICLVLLVNSGCFVTKDKYRLKEMELEKTEREYTTLKEKTGEIKQQLADLVKEKEDLEAKSEEYKSQMVDIKTKYDTSEEEKKGLSAQIDKLKSQIKEIEASLNEQISKVNALENERDTLANIILSIKELVADVEGPDQIKGIHPEPQEQPAKDRVEKGPSESPPLGKVEKEDEKPKGAAEADVSSEEESLNNDQEPAKREPESGTEIPAARPGPVPSNNSK